MRKPDIFLLLLALVGGSLFFSQANNLWPVAVTTESLSKENCEQQARVFLDSIDVEHENFQVSVSTRVSTSVIDFLDDHFDRESLQQDLSQGKIFVTHTVNFKKSEEPRRMSVKIADGRIVGFWRTFLKEDSGAFLDEAAAKPLAFAAVEKHLGINLDKYEERHTSTGDSDYKSSNSFSWQRQLSADPQLKEWVSASLAGEQLRALSRGLDWPSDWGRKRSAARAYPQALATAGYLLLAIGAVAALIALLTSLRSGHARLDRAGAWIVLLLVCYLGDRLLHPVTLFNSWDPLWPRWISVFRSLAGMLINSAWILVLVFIFAAAGDALDRKGKFGRGETLFLLSKGRFGDKRIALASIRGFAIGLVCGGVLCVSVLFLNRFAGGQVALQPRGFFSYFLNASWPVAASLMFFLYIALLEELGYRFFAGTWLMNRFGKSWLAVWLPALVYGLTHTSFSFLPPSQPWWGRALCLTLVGAVWGYAFLRYDALTVVLSHFAADLFIFNWLKLQSGDPVQMAKGVAAVAVPLIPALLWLMIRLIKKPPVPESLLENST